MFGDDLQTELTHMKATNKIGAAASSPVISGQASAVQLADEFQTSKQLQVPLQPKELQTTSRSAEETHHVIDKLQSLEVSQLTTFILHLVDYFKSQASSFKAGRIAHCIDAWKSITADSEILTSVCGKLILFTTIPVQRKVSFQPVWKRPKSEFIANEILSLLHKGVIIPSRHEPDEFISPIFLRDR